jgi:uncharacterized protein (DUF58 family)
MAYGGLCFILLLMAMSYGNNLVYIICFYLTSMGMALAKKINDQLDEIEIESVFIKENFAEDNQSLYVVLKNKSPTKLKNIEVGFGRNKLSTRIDIQAMETQTIELTWHPQKRGLQKLPKIRVQSTYPGRLFCAWKIFKNSEPSTIYSSRKGIPRLPTELNLHSDAIGVLREIKEYKSGDSPKRIHWRSLAKNKQLRTMVFGDQEESSYIFDWNQLRNFSVESKISQLTKWIYIADSKGFDWKLKLPQETIESSQMNSKKMALTKLANWNAT